MIQQEAKIIERELRSERMKLETYEIHVDRSKKRISELESELQNFQPEETE